MRRRDILRGGFALSGSLCLPASNKAASSAEKQPLIYVPVDGQSNAYNPPSGSVSPFAEIPPFPDNVWGFDGYAAQRGAKPSDEAQMRQFGPLRDVLQHSPSLAVLTAIAVEQLERDAGRGGCTRVWNTTGQGGQQLTKFLPGGTLSNNTIAAARCAVRAAAAIGLPIGLGPYIFVQGENGPHNATYEPILRQFLADTRRLLAQTFESPSEPPVMLVQINEAQNRGNHTWAVEAQYRIAKDTPGVFLACPMYYSPLFDNSHTTLLGRLMFAEMLADALATLRSTQTWRPLWPTSVKLTGAAIEVMFDVPYAGSLEWDLDIVKATPNFGFQFVDGSTEPPLITAVEIRAANTLRVLLSATPKGLSPALRYAWLNDLDDDGWPGGRGQLMSVSSRDSVYARRGFTVPSRIRHYAVRFEERCV